GALRDSGRYTRVPSLEQLEVLGASTEGVLELLGEPLDELVAVGRVDRRGHRVVQGRKGGHARRRSNQLLGALELLAQKPDGEKQGSTRPDPIRPDRRRDQERPEHHEEQPDRDADERDLQRLCEEDHEPDVHPLTPAERDRERAGPLEVADAAREPDDQEHRGDQREQSCGRVEGHVARIAEQLPVLVGEERDEREEQQEWERADQERERGAQQLDEACSGPPKDREHPEPDDEPNEAEQDEVAEPGDERARELPPEAGGEHDREDDERRELGDPEPGRNREEPAAARDVEQPERAEDQGDAAAQRATLQ